METTRDSNLIRRTARKAWRCDGDGAGGGYRKYAPECIGTIQPGTRYVEYLGESVPFSHGNSICGACFKAFWIGYVCAND